MERIWRHRRRRLRNWLVGLLGPALLRAWVGTIRLRWSGPGLNSPDPTGRTAAIYVFWHERLLPFSVTHRGLGARALISAHGDGEMLARVAEGLGHKAVRGSSTRGGPRALRGLLAEVESGRDFAVTPDGPRGPRRYFQVGAAYFASRSALPVIPVGSSYEKSWSLKTWDRFLVPRPFTRGLIHTGEPIRVPADLDNAGLEAWRIRLQEALRAVTEASDRDFKVLYGKGITTQEFRNLPPREISS